MRPIPRTLDPFQAAKITLEIYGAAEAELALTKVYGLDMQHVKLVMQQANATYN